MHTTTESMQSLSLGHTEVAQGVEVPHWELPAAPIDDSQIPPEKPLIAPSAAQPAPLNDVLLSDSKAAALLSHGEYIIARQGYAFYPCSPFFQSRTYTISSAQGQPLGHIVEKNSFGKVLGRMFIGRNRPVKTTITDLNHQPLLVVRQPYYFFFFSGSRTKVYDNENQLIGQSTQRYHLWRRRHVLSTTPAKVPFSKIDEGLWAHNFTAMTDQGQPIVNIDKKVSLGHILMGSSKYMVRLQGHHPNQPNARPLTFDERAVILASIVNIDLTYFGRENDD